MAENSQNHAEELEYFAAERVRAAELELLRLLAKEIVRRIASQTDISYSHGEHLPS